MARRIRLDLLVNQNGAVNGSSFDWPGGDGVLLAEATTWTASTLAIQIQTLQGTWIPVINYATTTPISLAANGMANFRAPAGPMRCQTTGVALAAAYASVIGVPANTAG